MAVSLAAGQQSSGRINDIILWQTVITDECTNACTGRTYKQQYEEASK